jgi:glycosyltransferase involved in cell wall biosynthesis
VTVIRICHLTSAHPFPDVRIFVKECRSLCAAGYKVSLITQHNEDEVRDGVRIRAIPSPRSRLDRMLNTSWRAFQRARREYARIYHFHDPELIGAGILLKVLGKKVIYDVHEDVLGGMFQRSYIPPAFRSLAGLVIKAFEGAARALFDGIVAATPEIARKFPGRKSVTIQNFPILNELQTDSPLPYAERPPLIGYAGIITEMRGAKEMIDAVGCLPDELGVALWLAGRHDPESLETELRRRADPKKVRFLGLLSRKELTTWLDRTRIGLILVHPAPINIKAQPNKLFEYMSAGIPVVASHFPLWREFVEGSGAGLVVDPSSPGKIAEALEWLLRHPAEAEAMGKRGRAAVESVYNWDRESKKLLDFYARMASRIS